MDRSNDLGSYPESRSIDRSGSVERRVTECLERRARGESTDVADLCADAPEVADEVHAALEVLDTLGLDARSPSPHTADLRAYHITEYLGGGAMGVVYLAQHASHADEVALKIVRPEARTGR